MIRKLMRYVVLILASFMLSVALAIQASEPPVVECVNEPPVKILLDTDPGGDDALAMLWLQSLAKQCLVEIVAVTTVDGNVDNSNTFVNTSKLLILGGFQQVEVGRAAAPEHRCPSAAYIHGDDGLGGLAKCLPKPEKTIDEARRADDIIFEKLNATPGEIILVAIGPLTNLVLAEERHPGILAKAKEVVIMGGTFNYHGNVTPHTEFNVNCNSNAAAKVFASRDDVVVLPLDVTHQNVFTKDRSDAILTQNPKSSVGLFIEALTQFMIGTATGYRETDGVDGFLVHDASTLAYLLYPETLLFRRGEVKVETQGEFTDGQTLLDDRHSAKTKVNAWVGLKVDKVNLLASLTEDLKILAVDSEDDLFYCPDEEQ